MSNPKLRTEACLRLLFLINLVFSVKCDSERPQTLSNFMTNVQDQLLLRGSYDGTAPAANEGAEEPLPAQILKNPNSPNNEEAPTEEKATTANGDNAESETTTATPKHELYTTEPSVYTTTNNEETQIEEIDEQGTEEEPNDDAPYIYSSNPDVVNDVSTESDLDSETMSSIGRTEGVYKHSNILSNDNYVIQMMANRSNNIDALFIPTEKVETTTIETPRTTEQPKAVPRFGFVDNFANNGLRSSKTDLSGAKQAIEKRNFEIASKQKPIAKETTRSSTLKAWLEDSWLRPPPGILVPLRAIALTRALAVWNDLISKENLNITDIIIIGYDANGINWRSRHNLQRNIGGNRAVSGALSKLAMKYRDAKEAAGDGTMRALSSATKLVPYDSALFIVTDKGAADAQKLPFALRSLVAKRLKVYTIWTDPLYPSKESNLTLESLRKISQHTEGDVLPYNMQIMDIGALNNLAAEFRHWDMKLPPRTARLDSKFSDKLETLLVRRGGGDAGSHGIPVENGVDALRVYIEGAVEHAILYPPNGPQIDLLNASSVSAFSPDSRTDSLNPRDVFLAFPSAVIEDMLSVLPMKTPGAETKEPTVGFWHLSVRCDTCEYRLTVSAHAKIGLDAALSTQGNKEIVHLRVKGPAATVRETTIVDEHGTELGRLPYSYEPATGEVKSTILRVNKESGEPELVADIPLPQIKENKIYVKIFGRDNQGESFMRLAGPLRKRSESRISRSAAITFPDAVDDLEISEELNQRLAQLNNNGLSPYSLNNSSLLPNSRAVSQAQVTNQRGTLLTAVQIGLSTRLYGAPGDNLQLHYEVTNYRDQAVSFKFEAIGELRFLRDISPKLQIIRPGQTANVICYVGITTSAAPGARDLITFTAYGLDQVSIAAYVYVTNPNNAVTDVWAPTMYHNFQGTCFGKTGDDCAQYTWSATIVARDTVGGILRITSSPVGLVYETNFISGTREEITASYRSTCCLPRVMITAIDTYGNANSYVVDISNYVTGAGIAAIVLGVFIFIAVVALIVFLIYKCVKRRKESRELPYTASRRELS